MPEPTPPAEIRALTGLRGLAALLVTLFHYYGNLDASLVDIGHVALRRLYLCVDLFFILSGYVMAMTYGARFGEGGWTAAWRGFLLRRLARIYPLYVVTLLGCMAVALALYGRFAPERGGFPLMIDQPWRDVPLNLLLMQSWGLARSALVPAWSISTEWAAYLLFPLLVLLMLRGSAARAALGCLLALLLLAAAVWITAHDGLAHGGPLDASQGEVPGALLRCLGGFLLGMATWRVAASGWLGRCCGDAVGVALLALLGLAWLWAPGDLWIYPLLPPLVLLLGTNRGRVAAAFGAPLPHALGLLSYAVYLLHYQLAGAIHGLEAVLAARLPVWLAYGVAGIGTYGLLLAAAAASYRLVELPGRRLLRGLERRRGRRDDPPPGLTLPDRTSADRTPANLTPAGLAASS
ncbi:acyltransferase [Roseomonas sp. 18066]|uniref:acyltransferase family protein n=1 Tax=Roseomonas sp. 18066 TaxID=2681412 RepID=UPI001358E3B6|nr:acyltransferase [Roseomonas sp. 18066]